MEVGSKHFKMYLLLICCIILTWKKCCSKRITYMSLDHARIIYQNRELVSDVVFKSRLLSRKDPVHYVTLNLTITSEANNTMTFGFYFYQKLSNVYKRSFVEIQTTYCDLMEKDQIMGEAVREGYYNVPANERLLSVIKCPAPPGFYSFLNMKFRLSLLMDSFPFPEGRVYINVSTKYRGIFRKWGDLSIDFQLKTMSTSN